jgi:ABC-type multidrug transport system permease subunit
MFPNMTVQTGEMYWILFSGTIFNRKTEFLADNSTVLFVQNLMTICEVSWNLAAQTQTTFMYEICVEPSRNLGEFYFWLRTFAVNK